MTNHEPNWRAIRREIAEDRLVHDLECSWGPCVECRVAPNLLDVPTQVYDPQDDYPDFADLNTEPQELIKSLAGQEGDEGAICDVLDELPPNLASINQVINAFGLEDPEALEASWYIAGRIQDDAYRATVQEHIGAVVAAVSVAA